MSRRIVLLDGGMGQELLKRSKSPPTPLWSAQVLMDEPEIVESVHREYAACGCRVATLSTYSATPERLARDGDPAWFLPLQKRAIELARNAIANAPRKVSIAGCLPPLVASYRPDFAPSDAVALATYRAIVEAEKDDVDVFLCETLASVKEIRAATTAAAESGRPVWTSMTVVDGDGTRLRSIEPLSDGVATAKACGAEAVLVNCSWPESVGEAMATLAASGLPFGGYANAFTGIAMLEPGGTVQELEARDDLDPETYACHALRWAEAGASIIGGCCEVGPAHMRRLHDGLTDAGYEIAESLHG